MRQINERDEHGRTPLHQSAILGDWEAVAWLLNKGAFVDARDNWERTPLFLAIYEEILVVDKDRLMTVAQLLQRGADVNVRDAQGDTPLHMAAWWGQNRIVALLLEFGADSHARNAKGETPLDIAAGLGEDRIAASLATCDTPVVAAR